ncbi:aminotransferase class I/II-fold pyridoxal phosphate-dependent enzyme [Kyrpidia spormannii]|uniref:LL-diaminopimelate aminotransferase n=1 Tax=Kyrpidia spormannii TaxID=2055160 RepID=A0ACA8ZB79_9BACL|nr:aminotransferase class I/II-fold pyridoxal phosphate-dependent enzyme [Kyrpidia spormannii]CAB3394213.1 LL-diaminopimelate aminotransferase [Kyrpidia spormannii]
MPRARKLAGLSPYIFAQLEERVYRLREQGVADIVDLGKADPDHPSPDPVVRRLQETAADPENHHYPAFRGSLFLRRRIAEWYKRRFGVNVDPDTEVMVLLGSKEGLFHVSLAYVSPGDVGLIPDPAFPAYNDGIWFAGGRVVRMPLLRKRGFTPDLSAIPEFEASKARVLFLNYPHNPTGALAPDDFMAEVIRWCREREILLCYDNAYSEITFDGHRAKSLLQYPGGREVGVEFTSFSKTYNMAGWRLGAAVGHREAIESLLVVQSHVDSGVFAPIQFAGATALETVWPGDFPERQRLMYQKRRDDALARFAAIGWPVDKPPGTVYLWVPVPDDMTSETFADKLLDEYHVVVAPGTAFGPSGEGHVRLSLTTADENVHKGVDRICTALRRWQPQGAPKSAEPAQKAGIDRIHQTSPAG